MIDILKKIIPKKILNIFRPFYHGLISVLATMYFFRPSEKMTVIGVTGTGGKSSTVEILRRILSYSGNKCGSITTIGFFDGENESINKHGLSMPGGFLLQKSLSQMLKKGCKYAVVECTSEGLAQNRHLGIKFDAVVLTNLSEAHIQAHGSFENYKKAKAKLFLALAKKGLGLMFVNSDDAYADYFLRFWAKKKIGIGFSNISSSDCNQTYFASEKKEGFVFGGLDFSVKIFGDFNKKNAFLATVVALELGCGLTDIQKSLEKITSLKGRMEIVPNNFGFQVIVDYGCEPATFLAALKSVKSAPHRKIIHVFGSTGGHRDVSKRFYFGKVSALYADHIIVTNDDVYDSNPEEIAKNIEEGIQESLQTQSKKESEPQNFKYEIILDRRLAIERALKIARAGDVVLFTGKSSEQFLVLPGNKRIVWDEVEIIKEILADIPQVKK